MDTDELTGYADGGGPPFPMQNHPAGRRVQTEPKAQNPTQTDATQSQPTGRRALTDPIALNSTQSSSLGMSDVAGTSRFFPEGAIFGGRWPRLHDDSESLTSHRPVDRTSGWNHIIRVFRSGGQSWPC